MSVFQGAVRIRRKEPSDDGLDGMTASELRATAKEMGLSVPTKATKAQLVAAIRAARG